MYTREKNDRRPVEDILPSILDEVIKDFPPEAYAVERQVDIISAADLVFYDTFQ